MEWAKHPASSLLIALLISSAVITWSRSSSGDLVPLSGAQKEWVGNSPVFFSHSCTNHHLWQLYDFLEGQEKIALWMGPRNTLKRWFCPGLEWWTCEFASVPYRSTDDSPASPKALSSMGGCKHSCISAAHRKVSSPWPLFAAYMTLGRTLWILWRF